MCKPSVPARLTGKPAELLAAIAKAKGRNTPAPPTASQQFAANDSFSPIR
jgi:hypothetical protein